VKYLPLIWAGLWRKRGRSLLILAQVIIAFTLFGVLQGLNSGVQRALAETHADRLYVSNRLRLGTPMPIAMLAKLQTTPGVVAMTYRFQFGTTYQNDPQGFAVIATEVDSFIPMYPEQFKVTPSHLQAMQQRQDGALVGVERMRQFGWKVGQRVTVQSPMMLREGTRDWPFDIVGTYENPEHPQAATGILLNYRYVNEALSTSLRDIFNVATVRIADPTKTAGIEQAIDAMFANSPNETLTQSEHELVESQVSNLGDLGTVVHRITAATFFVLLFATGALMMQSIRERTPEIGVLKTIGFSDKLVMALILCETALLCVGGAVAGLAIASRLLPLARTFIGLSVIPGSMFVFGFASAVLLALGSGAIPAWRGLRLKIVDALAGR
jgi:putative ABC transport system permease protein